MLESPLTWGQQDIWRAVVAARPEEHYLNIGRIFAAPKRPVTVERAVNALDRLVARHEALRTRLSGPRDHPRQRISPIARPYVEVTDEPAQVVCDRLSARPFDYWEEWPLRVAFLVDGDRVRHVVLVLCHLAADGHAAELLVKDFRLLLLRDSLPPVASAAPREIAAWQRSEEGRRVSEEALSFWRSEYRRMDPVILSDAPRHPRFWEATLTSVAIAAAAQAVAARARVSSSTVLLTAAIRLAGRLTGQRFCGMRVIVNNRFAADRRDVVSTISQEGLVLLDLRTPDFGELARQGWRVAMKAYRQAQFDPYAMEEAVSGMGTGIRSFGCFNDQRLVQRDEAARPDERAVRASMERTELAWTDTMDRNICDFRLHVGGEPGRMEVSLYADTALLAPPAIERFLFDLESTLVEAAFA
ncbi:Condensation domain-containing protein [Nonomuraea solani]|uniref:Condensation domain-containing protein n=1 Tax=Nonomuraea solani TaxID=1144553 RepID=A0A1H6EYE7_9ACTN|nr:condensation domain-containing protein [Nonomuraea solani]SEH02910.1 Condensation domain-containing protein [Nonomuraea solani]